MSAHLRRRIGWIVRFAVVLAIYLALREYADRHRSAEAVLGLFHGDPAWHALVTIFVLMFRVLTYAMVGGTLLAWPLEEWLLRERGPTEAPERDRPTLRDLSV